MTLFQAFNILNLEKDATREDIKRQYRLLATQWHPDKYIGTRKKHAQAVRKMQQINAAYTFVLKAMADQPPEPEPESKSRKAQSTPPNHLKPKKRFRRVTIVISFLLVITCLAVLLYHFLSVSFLEKEQTINEKEQTDRQPVAYTATGLHVSDFNHLNIATRSVSQQHLQDLGYPIGTIDGILGQETMGYLRAFYQDFGITMPKNPTPETILKSLSQQARIAKYYPEWVALIRSDHVQKWYKENHATSQRRLRTDRDILSMLDQYAFNAAGPLEKPLPTTGILWQQKKLAEQIIIEDSQHEKKQSYFLKITCQSEEIVIGFLRGGDRLLLPKPSSDKCQLVFVTGEKWYGKQFLFGPETQHGTIPFSAETSITLGSTEQQSSQENKPKGSVYAF